MISTVKETIRNIKLYELGIKDKLDGYNDLMSLRGLNPFKTEGNETYYGKENDIKFEYYNDGRGYIFIEYEIWKSIEDSFKLSYDATRELTMWSIGSDSNLEGVRTVISSKLSLK